MLSLNIMQSILKPGTHYHLTSSSHSFTDQMLPLNLKQFFNHLKSTLISWLARAYVPEQWCHRQLCPSHKHASYKLDASKIHSLLLYPSPSYHHTQVRHDDSAWLIGHWPFVHRPQLQFLNINRNTLLMRHFHDAVL